MAKSKKSSSSTSTQDKKAAAGKKADAKATAKAAAKLAALSEDAKKARKAAEKATRTAQKAQAKAIAAGAAEPKAKASEADLLKLALRSAEAKLTDAERKVESLERQIADLHTLDDQVLEDAIENAIVDAAVEATVVEAVVEAVVDAEVMTDTLAIDADEAEAVAAELDDILTEAEIDAAAIDPEPSHEGEAADAATVFAESDAGAEPTVTSTELTPPLPVQPADDEPSESWTLLQLRGEAKSRGLTGTSNLPKAVLLERLRSA